MCRFCVSEKQINKNRTNAVVCALLSAVFYALSTPFSKLLLNHASPAIMAGFLYLGAGIGMGILYLLDVRGETHSKKLTKADLPYTIGMIVLDIVAPICLMFGIRVTMATSAALLGNFEIVATALIAQLFFREKISPKLWASIGLITVASLILSSGINGIHFQQGDLLVLLATCFWGLENNCTQKISGKNTFEIVIFKGLLSGSGSLAVALLSSECFPALKYIASIMFLGFVTYGMSIFLYVRAQRELGAAQTSACNSAVPYIGTFLSFLINDEKPTAAYYIALILMLLGTTFLMLDMIKKPHSC